MNLVEKALQERQVHEACIVDLVAIGTVCHTGPHHTLEQIESVDTSQVVVDAFHDFHLLLLGEGHCFFSLADPTRQLIHLILDGAVALQDVRLVGIEHSEDALSRSVLVSYLEHQLFGVASLPPLLVHGVEKAIEGLE